VLGEMDEEAKRVLIGETECVCEQRGGGAGESGATGGVPQQLLETQKLAFVYGVQLCGQLLGCLVQLRVKVSHLCGQCLALRLCTRRQLSRCLAED